jgi:hypothetical protein
VLITLEATVPQSDLPSFILCLKKIIEVYAITTYDNQYNLKKTGFYRMSVTALNNGL